MFVIGQQWIKTGWYLCLPDKFNCITPFLHVAVMTTSSITSRRTITLLIVHCTATPAGRAVSLAEVDQWHRQRGWKGIGYHYLILLDGTVERGRLEAEVGAHCQNHNAHSIGICYVGGLDSQNHPTDTRTPAQRQALRALLETLHVRYPQALIVGHHLFNPSKACPCFDAASEYADLQPKSRS